MVPRQNKNNAYAKFWRTNKDYYGIFESGLSYDPPINFCGLSLDKTDHVIQNLTMVIRGYPPSDFISTKEKPRNEQTFKLNF